MKIILLGYMASGKSVIGKLLAQQLGISFLDLDEIIEKEEQNTIEKIFETQGEIYFRKIEHQHFKQLLETNDSFVLSLGGGTPCYAGNDQHLNGASTVSFYLQTPLEILCKRLENEKNTRPLIANKKGAALQEFIAQHLFERSYFYHKATYTINTGTQTPEEIVSVIKKHLS